MSFWLIFFALATAGEGAFAFYHFNDGGVDNKDFILSLVFGLVFLACTIYEVVRLHG